METFYRLPDIVQFLLALCFIFAGTMLAFVILVRYFRLQDLFDNAEETRETSERISQLELKLEEKVKERTLFEIKNNEIIKTLEKQLEIEMVARQDAETEKNRLQKTFNATTANLNERMDELDAKVEAQSLSIQDLQKQLEEKNGYIKERDNTIAQLQEQKKSLEDTQSRLEMERNGMLAMARELGLKVDK